jgi:hypothetical protein
LPADEQHHPDQDRDDHNEVGAVDELDRHDDEEDDRGQTAPKALTAARQRSPASDAEPVLDHPDLRQREADEHADRVQRDEGMRVAAEDPQQAERDRGQDDDPTSTPAGRPERELARHEAILGEDRGQPGNALKLVLAARNRMSAVAAANAGTNHDPGRTRTTRPRRRPMDRGGARQNLVGPRHDRDPDEQDRQQDRHDCEGVRRVLRPWLNAGTPLAIASTPVSATIHRRRPSGAGTG